MTKVAARPAARGDLYSARQRAVHSRRQATRSLGWDPAKEQFLNDAEANALLDRPMRPPWKL